MSQKKREINSPDTPVFFNPTLKRLSLFDNNPHPEKKQCILQPLVINQEKPLTTQSIKAFLEAHNTTMLLIRISPWFAMLPQFKMLLDYVTHKPRQRSTNPEIFFNNADIAAIKKEILATKLQILHTGDQILARHFIFSCMKLIKDHLQSDKIYPGLFSFLVTGINTGTHNKYKSLDKDYILEVFQGPEEAIALLDDITECPTILRRTQALNLLKPYIPEIIAKVQQWYTPDNLTQIPPQDDSCTVSVKTGKSTTAPNFITNQTIAENNFVHPVGELPTPATITNFAFFQTLPNLSPNIQHTAPDLVTDSTLTDSEKEWLALLNV